MNKEKNIILVITSLSHLVVHAQMMVFPTLIIIIFNIPLIALLGYVSGGIAPAICGWITNYYSVEMLFPFIALSLLPGVLAGWLLLQRLNQTS